ncbi:MAG: TPM domain-containing protein [Bacteroidales bacterium]|jgi:uncharacterized membrane protein|nr:TPM domain-containing protein [Bacteroidales bacterium]
MSISAKSFFSHDEKEKIKASIREAEMNTSGEIRLHVENKCPADVLDRAAYIFGKLSMHKTERRNGVLFYLSVIDHKFAIIGDKGINSTVPEGFWDEIKSAMLHEFQSEAYTNGICLGMRVTGEALKKYFPYQMDDINELPDDISFGEN